MLQAVIAIGDAELRRGNAELAAMGGNADVREHRHLHAAAETKALDAGNGRLGIIGEQRALGGAAFAIFLGSGGVMACLLELADVGARHERLAAAAAQDHDAHGSVIA